MESPEPSIKEIFKEKKVSSIYTRTRNNAASIFLKLVYKVQDKRLSNEEKDRGEKIQDNILLS